MLRLVPTSISTSISVNVVTDIQVPQYYLLRLIPVMDELGVVVVEDIVSIQGDLLVPAKTHLSVGHAKKILGVRLRKPFEYCINFDQALAVDDLEKDLFDLIYKDALLQALNEHQPLAEIVKPFFASYAADSFLQQMLSVMARVMPELYLRTLYCVWFSVLIAKEMRFAQRECEVIFLSALAHDIGMMYVDPAVLAKKGQLDANDWMQIQQHVDVARILMEPLSHISRDVIEAVSEHHERCDGTGYPSGKVESELSFAGKIVALADSIIAIFRNHFDPQHRSWRNVIPVIQMNAQTYFFRHDEILATLWRRSEMPIKQVVHDDSLQTFAATLLRENRRLSQWFEILRDSLLSIGFTHGDRQLHAVQNIMLHVTTSAKGSGVFNQDINDWLREIENLGDENVYRQLEKAQIQQQEILFHLQRLSRMTQLYVNATDSKLPEVQASLGVALQQIAEFLTA